MRVRVSSGKITTDRPPRSRWSAASSVAGAARPVAAVHGDESRRRDRPSEHGHAEDAALGEKSHLERQAGEEHDDVAEALVVGRDDGAALRRRAAPDAGRRPRRPETKRTDRAQPRAKREEPVAARREERGYNGRNSEPHGEKADDGPDDEPRAASASEPRMIPTSLGRSDDLQETGRVHRISHPMSAPRPTTSQPSATALFYRNIRWLRFVDRFGRKGQGMRRVPGRPGPARRPTRSSAMVTRPFYRYELLRQMDEIGVKSVSITGITAFFTGMVLALQTAYSLAAFGGKLFIGRVVVAVARARARPGPDGPDGRRARRLRDHGRARLDDGDRAGGRAARDGHLARRAGSSCRACWRRSS